MKTTQVIKGIAATTALGIFLAGCSGGSDSPTKTTLPATTTTTPSFSNTDTIPASDISSPTSSIGASGSESIDSIDAKLNNIEKQVTDAAKNSKKAASSAEKASSWTSPAAILAMVGLGFMGLERISTAMSAPGGIGSKFKAGIFNDRSGQQEAAIQNKVDDLYKRQSANTQYHTDRAISSETGHSKDLTSFQKITNDNVKTVNTNVLATNDNVTSAKGMIFVAETASAMRMAALHKTIDEEAQVNAMFRDQVRGNFAEFNGSMAKVKQAFANFGDGDKIVTAAQLQEYINQAKAALAAANSDKARLTQQLAGNETVIRKAGPILEQVGSDLKLYDKVLGSLSSLAETQNKVNIQLQNGVQPQNLAEVVSALRQVIGEVTEARKAYESADAKDKAALSGALERAEQLKAQLQASQAQLEAQQQEINARRAAAAAQPPVRVEAGASLGTPMWLDQPVPADDKEKKDEFHFAPNDFSLTPSLNK